MGMENIRLEPSGICWDRFLICCERGWGNEIQISIRNEFFLQQWSSNRDDFCSW